MLAVGRNVAALTRFADVLAVFDDDPRIQVLFTISPGSPHPGGSAQLLSAYGAKHIPWHEAVALQPSLVISTSTNGGLHRLRGPLMMLPHGAGRHKLYTAKSSQSGTPYGLSRKQLMHRGRILPDVLGVSHQDQIDLLGRHCPQAVPRAVLIGDPCFDRLRASAHLRETYRDALGVTAHQDLVMISSTWGAMSAFDASPELPLRALRELPSDRYRIALALHPNIWSDHHPMQINAWYATARKAGLILVPGLQGWQATLLAADYVIGDHGSVTCYAAALGKPVLLAGHGDRDMVPGTPAARLATACPQVDPVQSLPRQLTKAAAPSLVATITGIAAEDFGLPGGSIRALREAAYRLMGLAAPEWEPDQWLVPVPDFAPPPAAAHRLEVSALDGGSAFTVRAFPAALEPTGQAENLCVLAADGAAASMRQLSSADIVYRRQNAARPGADSAEGERAMVTLLDTYPGCRIAALTTDYGCLLLLRDGTRLVCRLPGDRLGIDPLAVAAMVYAIRFEGTDYVPLPGKYLLHTGGQQVEVTITT